jgi:hypothetical protein
MAFTDMISGTTSVHLSENHEKKCENYLLSQAKQCAGEPSRIFVKSCSAVCTEEGEEAVTGREGGDLPEGVTGCIK